MLAKALATESKLNFISIKGPELFSKYVGDTEKAIREIFRKARISSPCIIFFDEIDAMASARGDDDTNVSDRALCQLLTEMDGIEEKVQVIVIAATNRLDILDKAILRPGRFDRHLEIPLPNDDAKLEILKIGCRNMPLDPDVDLSQISKSTAFFSGADMALI
jgi:transitional endoplasmic reticulum ATPase